MLSFLVIMPCITAHTAFYSIYWQHTSYSTSEHLWLDLHPSVDSFSETFRKAEQCLCLNPFGPSSTKCSLGLNSSPALKKSYKAWPIPKQRNLPANLEGWCPSTSCTGFLAIRIMFPDFWIDGYSWLSFEFIVYNFLLIFDFWFLLLCSDFLT